MDDELVIRSEPGKRYGVLHLKAAEGTLAISVAQADTDASMTLTENQVKELIDWVSSRG